MHVPAVLADGGVHAALWCQSQGQGAVLTLHINVEAAEARQEHHLANRTAHMHVTIGWSVCGVCMCGGVTSSHIQTQCVAARARVCADLREHMCQSLTSSCTGGFQQSAPNVTEGSRSPLNAWLRSHNKADL